MSPHQPTPDEIEHAGFILKYLVPFWQEILAGALLILSSAYLKTYGKNNTQVPVYVTDKRLEAMLEKHSESAAKDIKLCGLALENKIREEFREAMRDNNSDLMVRFKELLEAERH